VAKARFIAAALALAMLPVACGDRPRESGRIPAGPTFNKHVAPILWEHCGSCHRPGQLAPFSLLTYADVRDRARDVARVTTEREMPPWLPESGSGEFKNERRLRSDQIAIIQQWVKNGAIEGDKSELPPAPSFPDGWQLGQPDLVVSLPQPYTLPPSETDVFRNFVMPIALVSTRYVRAVEFRPGNPRIVHHAVIGIDRSRASRRLDEEDPEPGYEGMFSETSQSPDGHFVSWTPGKVPYMEAAEMAWPLERGTDAVLQMHMLPSTRPVTVNPQIGFFFTDTPPSRVPFMLKLGVTTIDIRPGDQNYAVADRYALPVDVDALSIYPHAHYLATEMKAQATLPDGSTKSLLWIKQWDFSWQDVYQYRTPLFLPRGTTITMQYSYNNSESNPHNVNHPPKRVMYGPHSSDEMGDLWLQILPRNPADVSVLATDYARRQSAAGIAGAEHMVETAPRNAGHHNFLGAQYLRAGRVIEAIAQLRTALTLNPRYAEAYNNLGLALQSRGQLGEAIGAFKQAVQTKPGDDRVHLNLANALNATGRIEEAIQQFEETLRLNPDSADAHNNLGILLGSRRLLDDAIGHFEQAVAINPSYADAHNNLAIALGARGQYDEAIRHARRALEIRPDYADAQSNLDVLLKSKAAGRSPR
jgi:tetratricopeptide (TPR) repeat protein